MKKRSSQERRIEKEEQRRATAHTHTHTHTQRKKKCFSNSRSGRNQVFARLGDKKYQVERARRQQQMENVRQEEHRGQEKNGLNAGVNSTVYVCWQCLRCLWLIFTEHFQAVVDVEQCSKQH